MYICIYIYIYIYVHIYIYIYIYNYLGLAFGADPASVASCARRGLEHPPPDPSTRKTSERRS